MASWKDRGFSLPTLLRTTCTAVLKGSFPYNSCFHAQAQTQNCPQKVIEINTDTKIKRHKETDTHDT